MNEPQSAAAEPVVRDAPARSRFEIVVDGKVAGFSEYRSRPGRITFTHTEVDDAYQGQGLAGKLVRAALDRSRRLGLEVTPLCPYVAGFIRKHPEYLDIVDDRHRAQLTASS